MGRGLGAHHTVMHTHTHREQHILHPIGTVVLVYAHLGIHVPNVDSSLMVEQHSVAHPTSINAHIEFFTLQGQDVR